MARRFTAFLSILVVSGCASKDGLVSNLPSPNFNGPVVQVSAPAPIVPTLPTPPVVNNNRRAGLAFERAWVPNVAARPWRYIVIHHSATPAGSAATIDKAHRAIGYDEIGYHFVIGNGTGSGNGVVEVSSRWPKQKYGAHDNAGDNRYNDYGIGICLVGDFEVERPTPEQLQSLSRLTAYLMRTYNISPSNVKGHGETKGTLCPGRNLNVASVKRMVLQRLADAGDELVNQDEARPAAGTELLFDPVTPFSAD